MNCEHPAEIEWSSALVDAGLPRFLDSIDPAWFWTDQPRTTEGWSLACRFESSPYDQGNPSRALVSFVTETAPHDRLTAGALLRLFERQTRQYATVRVLE